MALLESVAKEPDDVAQGDTYRPSPYLPTKQQIVYTKEFITVMLLLIALPWVIRNLLVSPQKLARALGGKVAGV